MQTIHLYILIPNILPLLLALTEHTTVSVNLEQRDWLIRIGFLNRIIVSLSGQALCYSALRSKIMVKLLCYSAS